jgi:hypothetical protein
MIDPPKRRVERNSQIIELLGRINREKLAHDGAHLVDARYHGQQPTSTRQRGPHRAMSANVAPVARVRVVHRRTQNKAWNLDFQRNSQRVQNARWSGRPCYGRPAALEIIAARTTVRVSCWCPGECLAADGDEPDEQRIWNRIGYKPLVQLGRFEPPTS